MIIIFIYYDMFNNTIVPSKEGLIPDIKANDYDMFNNTTITTSKEGVVHQILILITIPTVIILL